MLAMRLNLFPDQFAICQLAASEGLPSWASDSSFVVQARDARESTVVCQQRLVPPHITAARNWKCFQVDGVLDFSLVGIISSLTSALAVNNISVYVVSTFSSDYLLIREADLENAIQAWQNAGHEITI